MHRVDLHGRRCRLFTNDSRIPKLDVAGSIPVSRSMLSMVYEPLANFLPCLTHSCINDFTAGPDKLSARTNECQPFRLTFTEANALKER
jgi:hypothetical protein